MKGRLKAVLDARHISPHFPGIGRYVGNLARALPPLLEDGEEFTLLISRKGQPSGDRHPPGPTLTATIEVPADPFSLAQQWQVPARLSGMDVYHSPYYLMPYRPGVPTVLTMYDLIPRLLPELASGRTRVFFHLAVRLALRASSHVIAISESTRRDLLRLYRLKPDNVTAIPLAAEESFRPVEREECETLRRRLGLPEFFGVYVGINKRHKNLVRLIEAWQQTGDARSLIIAGPWDPRYPEARRAVVELGLEDRVRFLGPVDSGDLPALYSLADFCVQPSLAEGFGLTVLEAMACGTPVACSDRSGLVEVAGSAALTFDPGQTEDIARALRVFLQDGEQRREYARHGRARAAEFSWRAAAAATLEIYRRFAYNSERSSP